MFKKSQAVNTDVYQSQCPRVMNKFVQNLFTILKLGLQKTSHDNARLHTYRSKAIVFLNQLVFGIPYHFPYIAEFAPTDYHVVRSVQLFG